MTTQTYAVPKRCAKQQLTASREGFVAALRATADPRLGEGLFREDVSWMGVASLPQAISVLEEAGRLLADPANWCQGATGLDQDRRPVTVDSPDCRQRCLDGAIIRAEHVGGEYWGGVSAATGQLAEVTVRWVIGGDIAPYNDAEERTHAEVLDVLRQGVAVLREASK